MSATQHGFKAEVQQLLDLMIHSIYSDREVFVRELVSNAADALDKVRFLEVTRDDLRKPGTDVPGIRITTDTDAKTITFEDDGIGMTEDEVVQFLGTIAHSGTKAFLDKLQQAKAEGDDEATADLIGQFGIGFYSAFMVARQVDVHTLSAEPDAKAIRWSSEGAGTYTLDAGDRDERGTTITLHLRSDADDFADDARLSGIIRKYSNFVSWPITVGEDQANDGKAIWRKRPSEVDDDEANAFYKQISSDFQDPALTIHVQADTPLQYSAMLFVPAVRPWDLFTPNLDRGPRLYAKRVLITEHAKGLLPDWMRFVSGVVDSEDISLNVSREMVQQTPILRKIGDALVKRVLKDLGKLLNSKGDDETKAKNRATYDKVWEAFGVLIKEGYYHSGPDLRDRIKPLMMFNTRAAETASELVTLAEYVAEMPEDQQDIWYITAESREQALQSPSLEAFVKKGWDVLLLTDPVDEWMISAFSEFDGKTLKSVTRGELDLDEESSEGAEDRPDLTGLLPWMEGALSGQVAAVRKSSRLTDSAAVLVDAEDGMSSNMARILKQANQSVPTSARVLEVNPGHPLIKHLAALQDKGAEDVLKPLTQLLLDEARLLDGTLDEPAAMGRRVQDLLEQVAERAAQA